MPRSGRRWTRFFLTWRRPTSSAQSSRRRWAQRVGLPRSSQTWWPSMLQCWQNLWIWRLSQKSSRPHKLKILKMTYPLATLAMCMHFLLLWTEDPKRPEPIYGPKSNQYPSPLPWLPWPGCACLHAEIPQGHVWQGGNFGHVASQATPGLLVQERGREHQRAHNIYLAHLDPQKLFVIL